jgi:hypothetical protein
VEASDVELVYEVVERCPQVVVGVAEDQRKLGCKRLNVASAHVVLKTMLLLDTDRYPHPSEAAVMLVQDKPVVLGCPPEFLSWLLDASVRHGMPVYSFVFAGQQWGNIALWFLA